jgi:hypothetical protein
MPGKNPTRGPKVPTQIVDKNGKTTTVHKSQDQDDSRNLRLSGSRPFVFATTPEQIEAKQDAFLSDLSHDFRVVFPGAESFCVGLNEDADDFEEITGVFDKNGKTLYSVDEPSDVDGSEVDSLTRALRNFDYTRGNESGYVKEAPLAWGLFEVKLNLIDDVVEAHRSR